MIQGRCPICGKSFEGPSLDDLPHFPFCCDRCQWIDLGRWADGKYQIPGPPARGVPGTLPNLEDEDDDDS
ncbi:hypothetical protein BH23PLA1_BH23PLA1_39480 [soil metagenome]